MALYSRDAADLNAYFGLGYLEKSTAGPMLDRAWLYSEQVRPSGPVTAYPKGLRCDAKSEPNTDDLELIGRVSRKLAMLSPLHRKALEHFHGDKGAACALRKPGRVMALFELTKAGRTIVRRERKTQGRSLLKVTGAQLIANVVTRQELRAEERSILALALSQANALKERAEAAYTEATYAMKQARKRPHPLLTLSGAILFDEDF